MIIRFNGWRCHRESVINLVVPHSYPTVHQRKNILAREKEEIAELGRYISRGS
jgi:hypothetical protein